MLLPAPKFSAGPPTLGHHEFLSPTPARCPDRPAHTMPARRHLGFCTVVISPCRFISLSLHRFIVPIFPPFHHSIIPLGGVRGKMSIGYVIIQLIY